MYTIILYSLYIGHWTSKMINNDHTNNNVNVTNRCLFFFFDIYKELITIKRRYYNMTISAVYREKIKILFGVDIFFNIICYV